MENNEKLNNQVNENNNINQSVQHNNNKILIIIMALIIIGLVGYIVYAKFIQKNDSSEPKSNKGNCSLFSLHDSKEQTTNRITQYIKCLIF